MTLGQFEFLKYVFRPRRHVYLDHNATTSVSPRVRRKMNRILKHHYGNPSSLYEIASRSAGLIEQARHRVADAIHADPLEICFTGCATESNNAVLKSLSSHFRPQKKKIISTPIEHHSVINTLEYLKTQGVAVEYCAVDSRGRVLLEELEKQMDADTFLLCCVLANNETGVIQDIAAITRIAHRHEVLVLADCVQVLGKIPIDVHESGIDYASFSAHKVYGPKGIGALYIRQGSPFTSLLHGGHQENGMRAGTEAVHNIAGFGAACRDVDKLLARSNRIRALMEGLVRRLHAIKPDCIVNTPEGDEALPNTLSITFPGVENTELMAALNHRGIAVSAGSACTTGDNKPSHVLKAIGLSDQAARETIRISLGIATSAADIRYTARVVQEHLEGRRPLLVNRIAPSELDESVLFDDQTYILDIRAPRERKKTRSLPNSHEINPFKLKKYLRQLPRDKHIIVVCPGGGHSFIIAYYLKSKGFKNVSDLRGGLESWKILRSDLYRKYAGQNIIAGAE